MAKWQAAYWGEKGIDIYQMADQRQPKLLYSGPQDGLKPILGGMQRRILILGKNNVIRLRKQYPPMKMDKLLRAVEMEAPTLFPMANCSFHCRIFETYPTHVILDIWGWEREPLERLRAVFAFRYVIPEDLAFHSSPLGISIFPSGSMIRVLACGEGRFLDAAAYPAADFSQVDLERFLTGLADSVSLIKEIRFYGNAFVEVPSFLASRVKRFPAVGFPPYLETLKGAAVKPFRRETGTSPLFINRKVLLRFALYLVLAYGLMLFFTLENYEKALVDLKNKSSKIEKEISLLERGSTSQEDPEAIKDFEVKMKDALSPLMILDVLAAGLPEESYVKNLVLNNNVLEVTVSASNPLAVIKRLGSDDRIGKVSLKGSPVKEATTGIYNCALSLEVKR